MLELLLIAAVGGMVLTVLVRMGAMEQRLDVMQAVITRALMERPSPPKARKGRSAPPSPRAESEAAVAGYDDVDDDDDGAGLRLQPNAEDGDVDEHDEEAVPP
jgi:hypothetical protein